ncbi:MAG: hypothetical protein HON90_00030 [Halobacteriovoraceae bacterium]|jgi:hypothetical protein|nr:hypothetical protein [Halobacteriovoraceae bacterium]
MKKLLITGTILLSLVGCNKPDMFNILTTGQIQLDEVAGLFESSNISITYKEIDDSVVFESDQPLSFDGVRFEVDSNDKASKLCSIMGFYDLNKTQFELINTPTSRRTSNIYARHDSPDDPDIFKTTIVPVLHGNLVENTMLGSMFDYNVVLSTHYRVKSESSYLNSLTCYGTTSSHYKSGEIIKDEFFHSIFENQLATQITPTTNLYSQSAYFLVASPDQMWSQNNKDTEVYVDAKINFLSVAENGARKICTDSGYSGLLFYSIRYALHGSVPENIYVYNQAMGGLWSEANKPSKVEFHHRYRNRYDSIEVPGIYLNNIYCF